MTHKLRHTVVRVIEEHWHLREGTLEERLPVNTRVTRTIEHIKQAFIGYYSKTRRPTTHPSPEAQSRHRAA